MTDHLAALGIRPFTVVYAAYILLSAVAFRIWRPSMAALPVLLAGYLLLPRDVEAIGSFGLFFWNRRVVVGLALLLGVVVSDPKALLRPRPRWVDLPMAAFVLEPLGSLAANHFVDSSVTWDQVWQNLAGWALPYAVGRMYLADREAPRRISSVVVWSAVLYAPLSFFEEAVGPRWYLSGLVYGIKPHTNMVERLGGWRPEVFLTNGIELSTWFAIAATVAYWCWLRGFRFHRSVPGWVAPAALIATTLATRSVYGYIDLVIGLVAATLVHFGRTRAFLIPLLLVPPAYIVARAGGHWDGQAMVDLAGKAGKGQTVSYRLRAENEYTAKVVAHGPVFGFGGSESGIFDYYAQGHLWPDGWWVHAFRSGGAVGLSTSLLALFLWPSALGIALPADRFGRASPGALSRGMVLFVLLHQFDSLQNLAYLTPTALIGGSLVGLFAGRRGSALDLAPAPTTHRPVNAVLVATLFIVLLLEVLGQVPRPPGYLDRLGGTATAPSEPKP